MADVVFQGPAALTLDGKGRIAMPARHRELLTGEGANQFTVTKHPEGALLIFPRPAWVVFRDRVAALPMEGGGWKRVFLGNAMDIELDGSSRLLIPPELRNAARLEREVMLLGMGNHFELWDAKAYAEHEAAVMQSEMPQSLKSFSF